MAVRPIFIPREEPPYVTEQSIEFEWFPGFSQSQALKSILSLHESARETGTQPVLEISSKSPSPLGASLSAFNLLFSYKGSVPLPVENAFQGSKVFENGGPYHDLYQTSSQAAKKDARLRSSGRVIGFNLMGDLFPSEPFTAFYDWIYLQALHQNPRLAEQLTDYSAFSDIAFNPGKSINCQARSAAIYVGLSQAGLLDRAVNDHEWFWIIRQNRI